MLTVITLQNFKGIGAEPMRVSIKPLTILFGANSIGKSTIVQAVHYAREILERNNLDPDRTIAGGSAVDLGGFRSLVHNHDIENEVSLRFDLDLSNTDLPDYSLYSYYLLNEEPPNISGDVKSAWVELKVAWSSIKNQPVLREYSVGINGELFARTTASRDEADLTVEYNARHSICFDMFYGGYPPDFPDNEAVFWDELKAFNITSALPRWGEVMMVAEKTPSSADRPMAAGTHVYERFSLYFTQLSVGPGQLLLDLLRHLRYLGPLRKTGSGSMA